MSAAIHVVRVLKERAGQWHEVEAGQTLAEALVALSPDRWGRSAVDVYRGTLAEVDRIDLEDAPRIVLAEGERYIVAVRPADATVGALIIQAVLKIAISYALSRLFADSGPKRRVGGIGAGTDQPSPLNLLQPPRNSPRLGSRVPDIYGQMRTWPDLVFPPVIEWEAKRQTVRAVYCIGEGEYDVTQPKVGDTDLDQITDASIEVFGPEGRLPLDLNLVRLAPTFQSVSLATPTEGGGWTDWVRIPGNQVSELWIELNLPNGGMTERLSPHREDEYVHRVRIQYRTLDEATGQRGDSQQTVWRKETTTLDPLAYTAKVIVAPGAYEVRFERFDDVEPTDQMVLHRGVAVNNVAGMTELTRQQREPPGCTFVLLEMRNSSASAATAFNARSRFNLIATRRLLTLDVDGGLSASPAPTRRWCDAMAHMLSAPDLGAFSIDEINCESLVEAQCRLENRSGDGPEGGEFCALYDSIISVDEQVQPASAGARVAMFHDASLLTATVDRRIDIDAGGQSVPEHLQVAALYNGRNRNASDLDTGIAMRARLPNDTDGVELTWHDASSGYIRRTLVYSHTGATPKNPHREDAIGLVHWSQVYRYALYIDNRNRYRRISTSVAAFEDARLVQLYDVISVVQPWREEVVAGELVDYDGVTTLTLDLDPTPLPAGAMIRLRSTDGRQTDLIGITAGPGAGQVTLDRVPLITLETGAPAAQLGNLYAITTQADDDADRWLVLGARGRTYDGEISLANYDPRVFDGDSAALPPAPAPPFDQVVEYPISETFKIFVPLSGPTPPTITDDGDITDAQLVAASTSDAVAAVRFATNRPDGEDDGFGALASRDWHLFSRDVEPAYYELIVDYDGLSEGDPIPSSCRLSITIDTESIVSWDGDRLFFELRALDRDTGSGQMQVTRAGLGGAVEVMTMAGADPLRVGSTINVFMDLAHGTYGGIWFGVDGQWHDGADPGARLNPTATLLGPGEPEAWHYGLRAFAYVRMEVGSGDVGKFRVYGVTTRAQPRAGKYPVPAGGVWAGEGTTGAHATGDMRDPNYPGSVPAGTAGFLDPVGSYSGTRFNFDLLGDYFRRTGSSGANDAVQAIALGGADTIYSATSPDPVSFGGKLYFEIAFYDEHSPGAVASELQWQIEVVVANSGVSRSVRFWRNSLGEIWADRQDYGAAADTSLTANVSGDRAIVALDPDGNKAWFGINGAWAFSGDPEVDANPTASLWQAGVDDGQGYTDWTLRAEARLVTSGNGTKSRYLMQAIVHDGQGFVGARPDGFIAAARYVQPPVPP